MSAARTRPASAVTVANTSSGGVPGHQDGHSAQRGLFPGEVRSSRRASALAIAVATSSVNPASRASVSAAAVPRAWMQRS